MSSAVSDGKIPPPVFPGRRRAGPLPSLYSLIPEPPSAYAPHSMTRSQQKITNKLATLLSDGGVGSIYRKVLEDAMTGDVDSGKFSSKSTRQAVREREKVSAAAPSRRTPFDITAGESGFASGEDENELPQVRTRKRRRLHASEEELAVAKRSNITELPQGFPSGDLLASIHARAAALLSEHQMLLPPLSVEIPLLPQPYLDRINVIRKAVDEHEDAAVQDNTVPGSRKKYLEMRSSRQGKEGTGFYKNIWPDVERAFDSSALIALGVYMRILTSELVQETLQVKVTVAEKPVVVKRKRGRPRKIVSP